MRGTLPMLAALLAAGCSADDGAGFIDAGTAGDGGDNVDAAGVAGLIELVGDCDVLDTELTEPAPSAFANHMIFSREYTDADADALTSGGREIIADGNLNPGSLLSEVFAYENLARCEAAALLRTEGEVSYDVDGKKTDFTASIDAQVIGVSVVRAQTFPLGTDMTVDDARARLEGKLSDILESTANVAEVDAWEKQILAVVVYNQQHADALATAIGLIDAAIRSDTIIWLTITDGPDEPIYD